MKHGREHHPPTHRLRIEAERLRKGPVTVDFEEAAAFFDIVEDRDFTFHEAVRGAITARLAGEGNVLVSGQISTRACTSCNRCLADLTVEIKARVALTFMHDQRLLQPDRYPELVDDNTFYFDGEVIYPVEQLREVLMLELPSYPTCIGDAKTSCRLNVSSVGKVEEEASPLLSNPAKPSKTSPSKGAKTPEEESNSFAHQLRNLRRQMSES